MTDLDTLARGHAEVIQEVARRHPIPFPGSVGENAPRGPRTPRWLVPALAGIACLLVLFMTGVIRFPTDDPIDVGTTTPMSVPTTSPSAAERLTGNGKIVVPLGHSMSVIVPPGSVDTPDLPALATMGLQAMTWSPDGERVAGIEQDGSVIVFDPVSGSVDAEIESIASRACFCSLDWSPDGSSIAIDVGGGDLYLIDTTSWIAEPVEIAGYDGVVSDPSFSPDSDWIAVEYLPDEGPNGVAKVRPDGTGFTPLFEARKQGRHWKFASVAWSPVYDEIAVLLFEPIGKGPERTLEVGLVAGDGSGYRALTDAGQCFCGGYWPGLGWSPDGNLLALNIPLPDTTEAATWIISRDGSGLEKVGSPVIGTGNPAWQPAPTG